MCVFFLAFLQKVDFFHSFWMLIWSLFFCWGGLELEIDWGGGIRPLVLGAPSSRKGTLVVWFFGEIEISWAVF